MQRGDFWVFGYGSLMWMPGFDYLERRLARLDDFRRSFCLQSWHYRGTRERPGLVLGLDWAPGASCVGVALRICPSQDAHVRAYLAKRELVSYAYFETLYPVTLLDDGAGQGEKREALCYIVDRTHEQYAGGLGLEQQAETILAAAGSAGPNADYLLKTLAHLAELGIPDPELERLGDLVRARAAA
ncbi:MAG TPA: gamma-glutamylcyclotransferase [Paracoccaceae bacterium]|nr:gamma-glutamylcyclotransferase [Paracoccaceae bacterium]